MRTRCITCGKEATGERCRACRTRMDQQRAAFERRTADALLLGLADQGLSLARIGVQLGGITAPAVRMRLKRARHRQQLREETR